MLRDTWVNAARRANLSADLLAKALAAAGLQGPAAGHQGDLDLLQWTRPTETGKNLLAPQLQALADKWDKFRAEGLRGPFDLEMLFASGKPLEADTAWIADQLRMLPVGARSVFVSLPQSFQGIDWIYPVRVGMMSTSMRQRYAGLAESSQMIRAISEPVHLPEQRRTVDLLILDTDLQGAVETISRSPHSIHAHAVVVTQGSGPLTWAQADRHRQRILELVQAQAFVLTLATRADEWLDRLLLALSDNQPFAAACHAAGGRHLGFANAPLVFATRTLIHDSLFANAARPMLVRHSTEFTMDDQEDDEAEDRDDNYDDDQDRGVVNLVTRVHEPGKVRFRAQGPAGPARQLQAGVFIPTEDGGLKHTKRFQKGRPHQVDIHIGVPKANLLGVAGAFDESELPPTSAGGHVLTVVMFEPQIMKQPEVRVTFLPSSSGDSAPCRFEFKIKEALSKFNASICVLHENRVIEAATLSGPVVAAGGKSGGVIELRRSHAFRAIGDLAQRSRFDGAIVLHPTQQGVGFQSVCGNDGRFIRVSDGTVRDAVKQIHSKLDEGMWDLREFNDVSSPEAAELLRSLALYGNRIHAFLKNRLHPAILDGGRLQVVPSTGDTRFPVEFIYSKKPPADDAPVCPHAAEALRAGSCTAQCHALDTVPAPFVCPLGFWGLSRVIEWHAMKTGEDFPANAVARLDVFDADPRPREAIINAPALFAYSKEIDKADKHCVRDFLKRNRGLKRALTWKHWLSMVQKLNPGVLLLLVHSKEEENGTALEMGPEANQTMEDNQGLRTDYLTREHVFGPKVTGTPLVLLLGCSTDRSEFAFGSVASAVEDRCNAGIIVSTTNLIYGPNAVKIAERFLEELAKVANGESFGDVLLRVRREMLADGMCMVLCLNASGDADWKLVRKS